MNARSLRRRVRSGTAVLALTGAALLLGGCESDASAGMWLGAGLGALAGQAIGGDTGATLLGTAIGAGTGYVIGNESDKQRYESRRDDYDGGYRDRGYEGRSRYRGHDGGCNHRYHD